MEVVESTDESSQKSASCGRSSGTPDMAKLSREDLFQLFEDGKVLVEYYLSLKAAIQASRENGECCWCDPRDVAMRDKVERSRWRPNIVLKPIDVPESSDNDNYGLSTKQTALDDERNNKDDGATHRDNDRNLLMSSEEGFGEAEDKSFTCGVNGCCQKFSSLASHESHYHSCHNFVCASCKRTFVSNFLLDIHLQENHDSYFMILCSRIDMYRCLVESCQEKFRIPELRKDHLVRQHKFPASFSFHKPVKPRTPKSKASKGSFLSEDKEDTSTKSNSNDDSLWSSKTFTHSSNGTSPPQVQMEVEITPGETSRVQSTNRGKKARGNASSGRGKKVPPTICFGRGSQRAFQRGGQAGRGQHWHQLGTMEVDTTVELEKVSMADLADSLSECS